MKPIIFALLTFISTYAGGLFALRFKHRIHAIMAFTAGVLLGVVFFEIAPEIFNQLAITGIQPRAVMAALVVGFLFFHILEKTILIHHSHEGDYAQHKHPKVGMLSALALAGHSFLDGVGIGLGFQISPVVGSLVALAVISHDFTDGMNTITMMISHHNSEGRSKKFLLLDACAPILGAISTLFFTFPPKALLLYLGFFAGFLLYIGASDILPEAHSNKSSYRLILLTVFGVLLIYSLSVFA